jgi:hypothetical protein
MPRHSRISERKRGLEMAIIVHPSSVDLRTPGWRGAVLLLQWLLGGRPKYMHCVLRVGEYVLDGGKPGRAPQWVTASEYMEKRVGEAVPIRAWSLQPFPIIVTTWRRWLADACGLTRRSRPGGSCVRLVAAALGVHGRFRTPDQLLSHLGVES